MDNQYANPTPRPQRRPQHKDNRVLLGVVAILLVIVIAGGVWFAMSIAAKNKAIEAANQAREQAELTLDQALMNNEFDELNQQFTTLENQRLITMDDSVKRDLTEKYEAAKLKVEKLQQELKNQKNMSSAEIKKLKDEIASLRAILRNYVAQIAKLNEENEALRKENAEIKDENTRLSSRVAETSRKNEQLSERMTLAEKLNVTGVSLTALNKKGKNEKKVKKAVQLMATFTIPQNNSTPVGEKTIYMRIITPSGQVLTGGGSFNFEGTTLDCTAKRSIEYAGEEIAGLRIYWDVNTALEPGTYTVELFADNYRLASRSFELK